MKVQSKFDNKKIGELVCDGAMKFVQNFAVEINGERVAEYLGLDAVAKDWKDYKPIEPLIKDEKIRKAVRAWAEALKVDTIRFDRVSQGFSSGDGNVYSSINFDGFVFELSDGKKYTTTELCGEEEE